MKKVGLVCSNHLAKQEHICLCLILMDQKVINVKVNIIIFQKKKKKKNNNVKVMDIYL